MPLEPMTPETERQRAIDEFLAIAIRNLGGRVLVERGLAFIEPSKFMADASGDPVAADVMHAAILGRTCRLLERLRGKRKAMPEHYDGSVAEAYALGWRTEASDEAELVYMLS